MARLENNQAVHHIRAEEQLRSVIPDYPKIMDKRIVPELDKYCLEIIEHAAIAVLACSEDTQAMRIVSRSEIELKDRRTLLIDPRERSRARVRGGYASLYFMIPGVGHGLRVNGRLSADSSALRFAITGAYAHCARAAARSGLWSTSDTACSLAGHASIDSVASFLHHSPFLLMKTMNQTRQTELSPRGDQPGFVQLLDSNSIFIPERPGNKVAISLRNLLQNNAFEALLLIPGSHVVLGIRGHAIISTEPSLLDAATVENKRPKLGIRVDQCEFRMEACPGLHRAQVWQVSTHIDRKQLTAFPKVLSAHMHGEGLLGKATTPIVKAVVQHDMKHLY